MEHNTGVAVGNTMQTGIINDYFLSSDIGLYGYSQGEQQRLVGRLSIIRLINTNNIVHHLIRLHVNLIYPSEFCR